MENDYTFNYNPNDPEGRFIIHFTPLALDENMEELVNIYAITIMYLLLYQNTPKATLMSYNMMGQVVVNTTISDAINIISLEKSAYYVVKVMSNESVVTKKVFVK